MGFWQITARQWRAASSVNSRCESGRVTMSAKSACSVFSIEAASVVPAGNPMLGRERLGASRQRVGHRDEFDAVDAVPGLRLKSREKAGADHHAFQRWAYPWVHRII